MLPLPVARGMGFTSILSRRHVKMIMIGAGSLGCTVMTLVEGYGYEHEYLHSRYYYCWRPSGIIGHLDEREDEELSVNMIVALRRVQRYFLPVQCLHLYFTNRACLEGDCGGGR